MQHSGLQRYLLAKRTVDDRALNRWVLDALRAQLAERGRTGLRILDIGGGVGTMITRLLELGVCRHAEYVLVDVDAESLERSRDWLAQRMRSVSGSCSETAAGLQLRSAAGAEFLVRFVHDDATGERLQEFAGFADLLICSAFLDLVDVPVVLPALLATLEPTGLFWFTINFDGETILLPEHPLDSAVMSLYHETMDTRQRDGRPAGDSRTGRRLFGHLKAAGATLLEAGSSDWVVHAQAGSYRGDEAYFLAHVLQWIEEAVRGQSRIDDAEFTGWIRERTRQIAAGELVYIAHQLDFLGRR